MLKKIFRIPQALHKYAARPRDGSIISQTGSIRTGRINDTSLQRARSTIVWIATNARHNYLDILSIRGFIKKQH